MGKAKKRTNPMKIPLAEPVDVEKLILETSKGNMYKAWLLVLPPVLNIENITLEKAKTLWSSVNDYIDRPEFSGERLTDESKKAEYIMGFPSPYKEVFSMPIRTQGDLKVARRKYEAKALFSAMSLIALGMNASKMFTAEELHDIFLNVRITIGELDAGVISYDDLACDIRRRGLNIQELNDDMVIFDE